MSILTSVKGGKIAIDLKRLEDYTKTVLKKHDDLKGILPGKFKNVPPVVWFGDVEDERDRVLVISANPHNPEKCIESAKYWNDEEINKDYSSYAGEVIRDYNNYFCGVYSKKWFNSIEAFLNGLDASFKKNEDQKVQKTKKEKKTYQAIHIDLLPFATVSPFKTIANKLMEIDGLPEFINEHIKDLIDILRPKLVIVNGDTNFEYFNLCVNIGSQPNKIIYNGKGGKIWKSCYKIKERYNVISTSFNMGHRYLSDITLTNIAKSINKIVW